MLTKSRFAVNRVKPLALQSRRLYVQVMLQVVGRALQAISEIDEAVREELTVLPDGFLFEMSVMPDGPALVVEKLASGGLRYLGDRAPRPADLSIQFKHLAHAFLVLSFQEKTSTAFARNRMVADGDIGFALRLTRVLNRLEAFILPKLLAQRAVKEYPGELKLPEKLIQGARIYFNVATHLIPAMVKAS